MNSQKRNIVLQNTYEVHQYIADGSMGTRKLMTRDRNSHGKRLLHHLDELWKSDAQQRAMFAAIKERQGTYIEFRGAENCDLVYKSLENASQGIRLLNIREEELDKGVAVQSATVFVPAGKEDYFNHRIQAYLNENTKKGNPKNKQLVESIETITLAVISSFWIGKVQDIPGATSVWCEYWLTAEVSEETNVAIQFFEMCDRLEIQHSQKFIVFPEKVIVLAKTNREQIQKVLNEIGYVAEIRRAPEVASFFVDMNAGEMNDWIPWPTELLQSLGNTEVKAMSRIIIDFNMIPGIAELAIEMSHKTQKQLINQNLTITEQQENIKYFMEYISANNILLILKDVKKWLNEDGTMNSNMLFLTDLIVNKPMFSYATMMTTSRYIDIPQDYYEKTRQLPISGLEDLHISQIINNNLPTNFLGDDKKNLEFAKRLYGYPLGAKLGAYRIANHGYDYYLQQPEKIQALKVSLAKQLISYAELSSECLEYLKIIALCQSRLRNDEYILAFPEFSDKIAMLSDEAFFAGILKYSDDGCYKLELLVEDYFYDLAFNDTKCRAYCDRLEKYLLNAIKSNDANYMRLVPVTVHVLTLNGKIDKAIQVRAELTATITASMWDMYNHREYDEANSVAEQLITIDNENVEARYVKALCLTRFDEDIEAKTILDDLLEGDADNAARYYYALGRIQKKQGKYDKAIELYKTAILNRRRYLSPYRELAECYILMDNITEAKNAIENAKKIDESNVFVILLEARLLQKEDCADMAIQLLENQSIIEREPAQIFFRKGRAFDQLEKKEQAKECYIQALEYDCKTYDAKLCLLNHQIIDEPQSAEKQIDILKEELRGKRKFILTNIEARYVGYQKHDEEKAIEILENVPKRFRDRQWYAVKRQLLENSIEKHVQAKRDILANAYLKELKKLDDVVTQKYGNRALRDVDLLPDA